MTRTLFGNSPSAILLVTALGIAGGALYRATAVTPDERPTAAPLPEGPELLLVYVGASSCTFSNSPEFIEGLPDVVREFTERWEEIGDEVATLGVAIDWDTVKGWEHLRQFRTEWDQVSLGRSWANDAVVRYIWSNPEILAATPQIVVLRRHLTRESEVAEEDARYGLLEGEVLAHVAGPGSISAWRAAGFPLSARGAVDVSEGAR